MGWVGQSQKGARGGAPRRLQELRPDTRVWASIHGTREEGWSLSFSRRSKRPRKRKGNRGGGGEGAGADWEVSDSWECRCASNKPQDASVGGCRSEDHLGYCYALCTELGKGPSFCMNLSLSLRPIAVSPDKTTAVGRLLRLQ